MLGGTEIDTTSEAAAFTAAMRANPGAWSPRDMDPSDVRVGESFNLAPCVSEHWPGRTESRPCPRVELWEENAPAARIVFAALPEHTRPLLPAFVGALLADMPSWDAHSAVLRAMRALQSTAVTEWLRQAIEGDS